MPNPLDFLKNFKLPGFDSSVPEMSPEDRAKADAVTTEQQSHDPGWMQAGRSAIDGLVGFAKGALGIGDQGPSGATATNFGQLLAAGLPMFHAGLPGMYSRVERTAEALPEALHPVKAEGIFKNNAAKEEIDYRGLGDFLKGNQEPKVTKAAIQEHLANNPMPEIGVKDLGGPKPAGHIDDGAGGIIPYHEDASGSPIYFSPTKYERPSLNVPGGENYKERLLTLPVPEASATTAERRGYGATNTDLGIYQSGHWEEPNVLAHSRFDERDLNPQSVPKWRVEPNTDSMATTHASDYPWRVVNAQTGDPQFWAPNEEEAHNWIQRDPFSGNAPRPADFNATPVPGDRGRFIQEVQSDWHQAGKEHGYIEPVDPEALPTAQKAHAAQEAAMRAEWENTQRQRDQAAGERYAASENFRRATGFDLDRPVAEWDLNDSRIQDPQAIPHHQTLEEWKAANDRYEGLHAQAEMQRQALLEHIDNRPHENYLSSQVPDAPFKESWPDLVLKQHVLDVANKPDLNWLGFTTGDTQNARYDLAQHVRNIDYNPDLGQLDLELLNGDRRAIHAPPEDLHLHVGRDMARRIMENPNSVIPDEATGSLAATGNWHSVNLNPDEPLTVGGGGMRHFYDQKLPSALGKILKPFGGKVELGEIPGPQPKLEVRPRARALEQAGEEPVNGWEAQIWNQANGGEHIASAIPLHRDPVSVTDYEGQQYKGDAMDRLVQKGAPVAADVMRTNPSLNKGVPAWIAHLTPEMKKAILEKGLPLLTLFGLGQLPPTTTPDPLKGLKDAR